MNDHKSPKENEPRTNANEHSVGPIHENVVRNQTPPVGQRLLLEIDGIAHEYFHDDNFQRTERFSKVLEADIGWIEQFVAHAPSVGNHYEHILRSLLKEYLPSCLQVSTGFVYDSRTRVCSPQMDIIVYSDSKISPIHRAGDFVIVDPAAVSSVCEVKKNFRLNDLDNLVDKTIGSNLGHDRRLPYGSQSMNVFVFKCKPTTLAIVKRLKQRVLHWLMNFSAKTKAGTDVQFLIFKLSLPSIYFFDRSEYIRVEVVAESGFTARFKVTVLKAGAKNSVGHFLTSMNPYTHKGFEWHDLVSSQLVNVEYEIELPLRASLVRAVSNDELVRRYRDAQTAIRLGASKGNIIYGILISAFVNLDDYSTFQELTNANKFHWQICKESFM